MDMVQGNTGSKSAASKDNIHKHLASNLLFVSTSGDQSVSVFRIAPATGALTAVAGSPFATGLTLDSCAGISLAATSDGHFLMASSNGTIKTFSGGGSGPGAPIVRPPTNAVITMTGTSGMQSASINLNLTINH